MTEATRPLRVAAAQTPEFREDVAGALAYLAQVMAQAQREGASLLCLPEGYLQGYLTEDEPARRHALDLGSARFGEILAALPEQAPTTVIGLIEVEDGVLYNTAVVIRGRSVVGRYRKRHLLPGERCFRAGEETPTFEAGGLRFGINICFDTNFPEAALAVARQGASLLLCPANNMLRQPAANLRSFERSWFYSDSASDLPLLRAVTDPVAVVPDERLRAAAIEAGWPIIEAVA